VFHCGSSNARAFCAPFDDEDDISDNEMRQNVPSENMKATFSDLDDSFIALNDDGTYEVSVDLSRLMTSLPCVNISYRIYNTWLGDDSSYVGNTKCSYIVGKVYDPTVSCLDNSDSEFCNGTILCNDTSYSYNCSSMNDRYYCSPSDLSGKYGNLETRGTIDTFSFKGTDELMIPLFLTEGKSVVLECSDYSTKIACAKFTTESTSSSIKASSKSSKLTSSTSTNIILIVVLVLFGAAIFSLCGYFYFNKRLAQMLQGSIDETTPLKSKSTSTVV